ncbi:MAG: hypothetical protein ACPGFB_15855 [Verrucomicrobiales bacterium]
MTTKYQQIPKKSPVTEIAFNLDQSGSMSRKISLLRKEERGEG